MLLVAVIAAFVPRTFLTLDEITIYSDGFANQVFSVLVWWFADGGDLSDEKPLFVVHIIRTVIALFFQVIKSTGGSFLEVLVLCLFVWPVLDLFEGGSRRRLGLLLFFLVFLLSFRSVLVCLSVGYLFLYQLRLSKKHYLLISFIFASLSSGAVLMCIILVLREYGQLLRRGAAYLLYLTLLVASLAVSLLDKVAGFNSGEVGYEATVGNSTGLMAAISRNTIVVSILEGDYLRAAVYLAMLVFLIIFLVVSFIAPRKSWFRVVLLAGLPVMAMEGLGAIALVVPLLMLAAGVDVRGPRFAVPRQVAYETDVK